MKLIPLILLPLLLISCDRVSPAISNKPTAAPDKAVATAAPQVKKLIAFPALPVIENAVSQLAPQINAQFDLSVIQRICVLARGEVSKERILESIKQDGMDPATIPSQGHALSLLVNDDQSKRAQLCAAWLALGADRAPAPDEITLLQTRKIQEKGHSKVKERTVTENVLSKYKVTEILAVKLSVLRANAEIYALIASELEDDPGLSLEAYTRTASRKFTALAPYYLKRIQELYAPQLASYHLTLLNSGEYSYYTDGGYEFSRTVSGALLTYRGINWLGRGQIMGKNYQLHVSYFPEPLIKASMQAVK